MQRLVKDVMTRNLVTVPADAMVDVAIDLMLNENISGVPAVDDEGNLVGLITEYDVLKLYHDNGHDEHPFASCDDFSTHQIRTIQQDASMETAAKIFQAASLRRLLVVDGSKLVGILSRRDVLRCIRESRTHCV